LFNIATTVTVVIGVSVLYAALYVLALVTAFWFVVPTIFRDTVGHPVSLRDYFELAWVREAAYVQHSDEPSAIEETP